MSRLLLVRHGQSTWNAARRWQGQADPPLSAAGEAQARAAAPALGRLGAFDLVVCSPLRRARRTADLLVDGTGLPEPRALPGLMERDAGAWEGLTHDEIDAAHPGARERGWRPGDYESESHLRARVMDALSGLGAERALVVTHEGVIRSLDGDPDPLANLDARWLILDVQGPVADGPRFALADAERGDAP